MSGAGNAPASGGDGLVMAKPAQTFQVGDQVVDIRSERKRRTGRIVGLATLGGTERLYRIDFDRYELHLTADEIAPVPAP